MPQIQRFKQVYSYFINKNEEEIIEIQAVCFILQNNLANFIDLKLSGFYLSSSILKELTQSLKDNIYLRKLSLVNSLIDDNGAISIASWVQSNTTLHQLDLSYNKIYNLGAQSLAKALIQNDTLQLLNMAHNFVREDYFGQTIKQQYLNNTLHLLQSQLLINFNHNLTNLDMGYNDYNMGALENLLSGLSDNPSLQKIEIPGMIVGHIHIHQFCEILLNNSSLQEIEWDIILKEEDSDLVSSFQLSFHTLKLIFKDIQTLRGSHVKYNSLFNQVPKGNLTLIKQTTNTLLFNINQMNFCQQNTNICDLNNLLMSNEWILKNYEGLVKNKLSSCPETLRPIICKKINLMRKSFRSFPNTDTNQFDNSSQDIQKNIKDKFRQSLQDSKRDYQEQSPVQSNTHYQTTNKENLPLSHLPPKKQQEAYSQKYNIDQLSSIIINSEDINKIKNKWEAFPSNQKHNNNHYCQQNIMEKSKLQYQLDKYMDKKAILGSETSRQEQENSLIPFNLPNEYDLQQSEIFFPEKNIFNGNFIQNNTSEFPYATLDPQV